MSVTDATMAEPPSTQTLVTRAQQGDRLAFDELARRYGERLLGSIRSRLRASDGALCAPEDVLAETLLRALERLPEFVWSGEDSFLRWLFGISRNVRLDEIRRRRSTLSLGDDLPVASSDPTASRALRREERLDRLEHAIKDLPPHYREVVRLSRLEGLKTREVARRLGKSPDAVKHLLARAIRALRARLDDTESLNLPDRQLGGDEP